MSSPMPRGSKPTRLSPFFRDLATPIFPHRRLSGRFSSPRRAAEELPPPPVFTLDDRPDFSPEPGLGELPLPSPVSRTPTRPDRRGSLSPSLSLSSPSYSSRTRAEANGSSSPSWRGKSPDGSIGMTSKNVGGGEREADRGSLVDRMVEPGALVSLPPPAAREIATPEPQGKDEFDMAKWVTVFGFFPGDTNLVLRELEKCGVVLKHVPGPRDANWIHILYQNHYDAEKALKKNGMQLNNLLIIGVKPVDPMHRQHLKDSVKRINGGGFMVSLPSKFTALSSSANHSNTSSSCNSDSRHHTTGAVATPSNSLVSKVLDLVFGI
ncbi:nuclear pore complex protein [Canna indica]|uniref:Nuclear pore complex protein NUP35 n=1 Tax=Canna indica TaxID=4628 RepID=A0AAQ3JKW7_9LILI|nr:nuclear pore complex protein [Canna indica]